MEEYFWHQMVIETFVEFSLEMLAIAVGVQLRSSIEWCPFRSSSLKRVSKRVKVEGKHQRKFEKVMELYETKKKQSIKRNIFCFLCPVLK
jgi:hypothetical protein